MRGLFPSPDCIRSGQGPFHLSIGGGIRCLLRLELLGKNRQSGLACTPNQQREAGISEAEFVHPNSVLRCPVKEPLSAQEVLVVVGTRGEPLGKRSRNASRKLAARHQCDSLQESPHGDWLRGECSQ